MIEEIWQQIPRWEGFYEASSFGRVRSLMRDTGRRKYGGFILSPINIKRGYLVVNLTARGIRKQARVHDLVLLAFRGLPEEGMVGCHNNGTPDDNRLENLRWDTVKNNAQDTVRHGRTLRGSKNPKTKTNIETVLKIRNDNRKISVLSKCYGLAETTISHIKKRESWAYL